MGGTKDEDSASEKKMDVEKGEYNVDAKRQKIVHGDGCDLNKEVPQLGTTDPSFEGSGGQDVGVGIRTEKNDHSPILKQENGNENDQVVHNNGEDQGYGVGGDKQSTDDDGRDALDERIRVKKEEKDGNKEDTNNDVDPKRKTITPMRPKTTLDLAKDTYCNRERRHKEREKTGEIEAFYVMNDGSPESGKFLIGLKNIFSKCLPNMPKTYITRLVFDRRHRSVAIVRNGTKVIGGITYRPFHERRFAEIAFCAIAQTLQVSGFGTRLMNWTKQLARDKDGCEYFLTYADNAAVGYFSKQGFTKAIHMPKDRWHGYIKDYDGGTLMECYIHPTLPHTDLPEMIESQRKALDSVVHEHSTVNMVYPGLAVWQNGELKAVPFKDIPGVKEAGWNETMEDFSNPKYEIVLEGKVIPSTEGNLEKLLRYLLELLTREQDLVWPFLEPVDGEAVPDYYDIIQDPIDISTISKRLESGQYYISLDIFIADIVRMFENAKKYNDSETIYYKNAVDLLRIFKKAIKESVKYKLPDDHMSNEG